jgi:hypothetical protein
MALSEQERARIEEEERYRAEVRRRIRKEHLEGLRRDRLERMVAGRVRTREEKGQRGRLLLWVIAAAGAGFLGAALAVGSGFFFDRGADHATTPGSGSTAPPASDRSAQPTDRPADSPASSPRSATPREPAPRQVPQAKPPAAQPPPTESPRAPVRKPESTPSLPPRSSIPPTERVQLVASRLIETLGPERAEEAANANAAMYERGNPNFVYWRSVAAAVRSAKVQEVSHRPAF